MAGADAVQALMAHDDQVFLAEAALREDLIDELDARAVPGELVRDWRKRESKVLAELLGDAAAAPAMPSHVREASLRCISMLSDCAGLKGRGEWLSGALLLDLFWPNAGSAATFENLPAVCTAIVMVLQKNNSCTGHVHPSDLSKRTAPLARWLSSIGHHTDAEVSVREVNKLENAILKVLKWQVNLPSVYAWISALCDRFDVLSRGVFSLSVEWVRKQSLATAQMLVLRYPASLAMSPRCVATGLFSLFCVVARLVPLEALRSTKLTEHQWERLFAESQCGGAVPSCALPPARWEAMVGLVRLASGCGNVTMQEDALAIATVLREMANNIRDAATQGPAGVAAARPAPAQETAAAETWPAQA